MRKIKFQSYVEQVDITISHPEFGFDYYEDVTLPIFGLASRRVFKFKNSCYQ